MRLLYKASRDGFALKDFTDLCSEKGATLTLIKVRSYRACWTHFGLWDDFDRFGLARLAVAQFRSSVLFSLSISILFSFHSQAAKSGYIFGAFTAVSWPKPIEAYQVLADPSGSSFLFSLTNKYQRPFRMSLKDKSRSISLDNSNGPRFGSDEKDAAGKWIKFCNLMLMFDGRDARQESGCYANPHDDATCAYQLDPWKAGQEPAGFQLDETTFAGSHFFAAAEIEVYSLWDSGGFGFGFGLQQLPFFASSLWHSGFLLAFCILLSHTLSCTRFQLSIPATAGETVNSNPRLASRMSGGGVMRALVSVETSSSENRLKRARMASLYVSPARGSASKGKCTDRSLPLRWTFLQSWSRPARC
jgi:hypothetical protein